MILLVIIAGVLLWRVALASFTWQVIGIGACLIIAFVLAVFDTPLGSRDDEADR